MAWIMDTYSMHAGHTVPAVVTGKPRRHRRLGGPRGRHRPRRRLSSRCEALSERPGRPRGRARRRPGLRQRRRRGGADPRRARAAGGRRQRLAGRLYQPEAAWTCRRSRRTAERPARVRGFTPGGEPSQATSCWSCPCDVLVPAALENQITAGNAAPHPGPPHRRGRQRAHHARGRPHPPRRGASSWSPTSWPTRAA